jgi:hypothetical protein
MSSPRKLFFVLLVFAIVTVPALADSAQGNGAEVSGTGNKVVQINNVHTDVDKQFVDEDIVAPTYINIVNEAPVDSTPSVSMLGIGDADTTFMLYPNEVISFPAKDDTTYIVKSGTAIAVYVIGPGNDRLLLDSSESKLEYDPIYHKFRHGVVSPIWTWPQFTTKCTFATSGAGYIVLDNRYFPDYTMVEVIPVRPEE